jgi:hypothetical protein
MAPCAGPDTDCDTVVDATDNCSLVPNPNQLNSDRNFISNSPPYAPTTNDRTRPVSDVSGDVCDPDDDNDGVSDVLESSSSPCPSASGPTNPLSLDSDGDRVVDGVECAGGSDPASALSQPDFTICGSLNDTDGDGLSDRLEACFYNMSATDTDTDNDRFVDGGSDGCEVASINGDRIVNSLDQGLLASGIVGAVPYTVNVDLNKDGNLNSMDQGVLVKYLLPVAACP